MVWHEKVRLEWLKWVVSQNAVEKAKNSVTRFVEIIWRATQIVMRAMTLVAEMGPLYS